MIRTKSGKIGDECLYVLQAENEAESKELGVWCCYEFRGEKILGVDRVLKLIRDAMHDGKWSVQGLVSSVESHAFDVFRGQAAAVRDGLAGHKGLEEQQKVWEDTVKAFDERCSVTGARKPSGGR